MARCTQDEQVYEEDFDDGKAPVGAYGEQRNRLYRLSIKYMHIPKAQMLASEPWLEHGIRLPAIFHGGVPLSENFVN